MKKGMAFASIALCMFSSCAFATDYVKTVNKSVVSNMDNSTDLRPIPVLGAGFSDDMQSPISQTCFNGGSKSYAGGTKALIELGDAKSFSDIQDSLNVNVSVSGSIDIFSADVESNYAKKIQEKSYSESFYYLEKLILPREIYTPDHYGIASLNERGLGAFHQGADVFNQVCGNTYLQQQSMGADLYVTLQLNFHSKRDKENFDAHVGGGIGSVFDAEGSIEKLVNEYSIQGSLNILALQDGGDPAALAGIFAKSPDGYYISSCGLDDLKSCKKVIEGVINYAQNEFPKQVDYKDGKIIGNANPIDFNYATYVSNGIFFSSPSKPLPVEVIKARQKLGDLYKWNQEKAEFIDHLLKYTPDLTEFYHTFLTETSKTLHGNLNVLTDSRYGAIGCYLYPDRCVEIANNISQQLKPIDENILQRFYGGYNDRLLDGSQELYTWAPIGDHTYVQFGPKGDVRMHAVIYSKDGGNSLFMDGSDFYGHDFTANLQRYADGLFRGEYIYNTGARFTHNLVMVPNPI